MGAASRFKKVSHHEFVQSLGRTLNSSLSDSCGETLTLGQLTGLSGLSINEGAFTNIPLNYSSIQGLPALREAIAGLYTNDTVTVCRDNVAIFSGAQDALYSAFNCLLSVDDEVIVFTPCYPPLLETPIMLGAKVVRIPLRYDNQWEVVFAEVEAAVTEKTKVILLNFPHNPTGAILDQALSQKLLAMARDKGITLLVDDVSVFSDFDNVDLSHSYLSYDKTVVVGVMSKSFGLAGIRIGWAIARDQSFLEKMMTVKSYTSICPSVIDEHLALMALNESALILDRNNRIIRSNIAMFERFLERMGAIFEWVAPKAGILGIVKNNSTVSSQTLSRDLAATQGILILPGDVFFMEGEYFRFGFGREKFPMVLDRFERYLVEYLPECRNA